MISITRKAADRLYSHGNDQGLGYAPYTDVPGPDTVDAAVAAAIADGWTVIDRSYTTDHCQVLQDADGSIIGIGGDDVGSGAWAVPLLECDGKPCASGVDADGRLVDVDDGYSVDYDDYSVEEHDVIEARRMLASARAKASGLPRLGHDDSGAPSVATAEERLAFAGAAWRSVGGRL
jgi:hypothetical protein